MVFLVGSLLTTALLGLGLVSFHEEHDLTKVEQCIVTLIAHTNPDPASAVGAGGQQAQEQRGVGPGELPATAEVGQ